jgi:DNA-directed RNA polymerase specialized sigma24 family protein
MSEEDDSIKTSSDEKGFELLLNLLNPDRKIAEELCGDLRLIIKKFFSRKVYNRSDIEDLTQISILRLVDVVEKKKNQEEAIQNISGLAVEISKRIFLEYTNTKPNLAPLPPHDTPAALPDDDDKEKRYIRYRKCFDECLSRLNAADSKLFLDYYLNESEEKNKELRKKFAEQHGKSSGALKTYISRLRAKLKMCCINCLRQQKM